MTSWPKDRDDTGGRSYHQMRMLRRQDKIFRRQKMLAQRRGPRKWPWRRDTAHQARMGMRGVTSLMRLKARWMRRKGRKWT